MSHFERLNPVSYQFPQASAFSKSICYPSPKSPLTGVKIDHQATVLFVDMVGFTQFCAENDPIAVLEMLQDLLALLGEQVSLHGGSVEKYLGDGLMAVFHHDRSQASQASHAVACALAMCTSVAEWNSRLGRRGNEAIRIAIGIHAGQVIVGTIGDRQHGEEAIFGDTVNIASRVEGKCRCLDTEVLVTEQVMTAIRAEGFGHLVATFANFGFQQLRGRPGLVHVHGQKRPAVSSC
jgi:class 3 adenylate cyclase